MAQDDHQLPPFSINQDDIPIIEQTKKNKLAFAEWYRDRFEDDVTTFNMWGKCPFPIEGCDKLFGCKVAHYVPILYTTDINKLKNRELEVLPYCLFGFWGHGINSYRIVYCYLNENIRVYLKVNYGGIYSVNEEAAADIKLLMRSCDQLVNLAIQQKQPLKYFAEWDGPGLLVYGENSAIYLSITNIIKQASLINELINNEVIK